MNVYNLTHKGRKKFEKTRDNPHLFNTVGYKVLEYLYENGTGTVEQIVDYTGVSHSEAVAKLNQFKRERIVEVLIKL